MIIAVNTTSISEGAQDAHSQVHPRKGCPLKLKSEGWRGYWVVPLSLEARWHAHHLPGARRATRAPWEVGRGEVVASLGSIQTQGVSEVTQLPPCHLPGWESWVGLFFT